MTTPLLDLILAPGSIAVLGANNNPDILCDGLPRVADALLVM